MIEQEAVRFESGALRISDVMDAANKGLRRIVVGPAVAVSPAVRSMAAQRGIAIEGLNGSTPAAGNGSAPVQKNGSPPAAKNVGSASIPVSHRRDTSPVHPNPLPERRPENYPSSLFRTPENAPVLPHKTNGMTGATAPAAGKIVESTPNGWAVVVPTRTDLIPEAFVPAVTPVALLPITPPGEPAGAPSPARVSDLDPITIDLIESALRNVRHEMDAVLFRTAMSPGIREQHDEFPLVADPQGRMVVGQFGSYIGGFLREYQGSIDEGDVFLLNDPYSCAGAISHLNDWLVLMPIHHDGKLVGWASQFGHLTDVGGAVPGSMPIDAKTIHSEGVIIKPLKLFRQGELDEEALQIILNQVRLPEWNRSDLMGIVAACRVAERRVREMCDRFGQATYLATLDALLDRNYRAVRELIRKNISETPQSFEDYVDDDGTGFGPYKLKCTVWREGDKAIFDWSGTDPQSPAAINFYLNIEMFKMFVGVYLIMVFDPQILFNDGYYDLIEVRIPEGSLLKPKYPAALSGRTHALGRVFDVFGGALGKKTPEFMNAAGFSTSPHLMYSGYDNAGEWFQLYQIGFGGVPGRPIGDGLDGHSLWPEFTNVPNEYLESYFPLIIDKYELVVDSGGTGKHRGGNGIDQVYQFLADGEISIHDDRWLTPPWGVLGGKPGRRSKKILVKPDGRQIALPAKGDHLAVEAGDRLHYVTWGGGGWGDPLERDVEAVRLDVARGLVSENAAYEDYGVIVYDDANKIDLEGSIELRREMKANRDVALRANDPLDVGMNRVLEMVLSGEVSEFRAREDYGVVLASNGRQIDLTATDALRAEIRATRVDLLPAFDFGPPIGALLATCKEDTGLEPPRPPVFRMQPAAVGG